MKKVTTNGVICMFYIHIFVCLDNFHLHVNVDHGLMPMDLLVLRMSLVDAHCIKAGKLKNTSKKIKIIIITASP